MQQLSLSEAVERNIRPGDTVQVMLGHSRWSAAARELIRQFWHRDAELTLVMVSLGSLGAAFFKGRMVRKVITAYSGDSFPTYSPNPIFKRAYDLGEVEVEHWSIHTFSQRLEAAARGLPAMITGSLSGSDMEANDGYEVVETGFGRLSIVAPLFPDVCILHAAVADPEGNVAMSAPLLEGVWGAWAARRGAVVTVERVVDSLEGMGGLVQVPAHRVLAVVEAPFGAHPGGLYAPGLPVAGYGEDVPFWVEVRDACRGDFDEWAQEWLLGPQTHAAYLDKLGRERLQWLVSRSDPESWMQDAEANPVDTMSPATPWEVAAALGARELASKARALSADAILAGAGVANLAAWVAVDLARAGGQRVRLTAELGLWDYTPTPADPYIFNQRVFPGATMLADASQVLGLIVGGPGTTTIGCLGAAEVDKLANISSTRSASRGFLVGSGGGNDVASRAAESVVVTLAGTERLVASLDYVTSPGDRITSVVTDAGILRKRDGELSLAAVPSGQPPGCHVAIEEMVRSFKGRCGWDVKVDRHPEELPTVSMSEVIALRRYDPAGVFLGRSRKGG